MAGIDPTQLGTENTDIITFDGELDVETVAQLQKEVVAEAAEPTEATSGVEPAIETKAEAEARAAALPGQPPQAIPILAKRRVSGRYLVQAPTWRVDLRVDVDGLRPMRRVSADYYSISGATVHYFGSMIVDAPAIVVSPTLVTISGLGRYTFAAGAPRVRVNIPRVSIFAPPAPATLRHFTLGGAPSAFYACPFVSSYFRTVDLEQDRVANVAPFVQYNTGSLPSGGPARVLSVQGAYREAGIDVRIAGVSDVVPAAESGPTWSNAELHDSMERHFSLWRDEPRWKVWLFHAVEHDLGPNLLGIMYDQKGRQRQGCASFYLSLEGTTPDRQRSQLYTCTHELGHCFNLFHSFHKQFMTPPMPNRLTALSWMNYPQSYPAGGAPAFWSAFPFQFDDLEVVHLRHAFRNDIIMGGNPFGTGAALENPDLFADPLEDASGLRLELRLPVARGTASSSYVLGEPVTLSITLTTTGIDERRVHSFVHPNMGLVQIGILRPDGRVIRYRPPIQHCVADEMVSVTAGQPLTDAAYIGYSKDGFTFEQPGIYKLRAIYTAPDGSQVLSNLLTMRVRAPQTNAEEDAVDLLFGDEQGMLLYLLGSDAPALKRGNEAFDTFLDKHSKHPAAPMVRLAKGVNANRAFKTIETDGKMYVRRANPDEAITYLMEADEQAKKGRGDELIISAALQHLTAAYEARKDTAKTAETAAQLIGLYDQRTLPPQILSFVEEHHLALTEKAAQRERSARRRPAPRYTWSEAAH